MLKINNTVGSAEPLGFAVIADRFHIVALSDNTSTLYLDVEPGLRIRSSPQTATDLTFNGPSSATKEGIPMAPGAERIVRGPRLDRWWMDVGTAGDGVSITPLVGMDGPG